MIQNLSFIGAFSEYDVHHNFDHLLPSLFAIHTCTRTFIFTEPQSGLCLELSPIERPSEVQELFGRQTIKFTAFICSVPNFSPHAPCPVIIDRKERLANYMIIIPHSVKGNGPVIV